MLAGIGENAGVVDIGDGWAVTFKVESHNHPSYVEPYQGAATGVGGIVRDIMAMVPAGGGDGPVALARPTPDTRRVVDGVVAASAATATPWACRNIGGGDGVRRVLRRQPLVNAMCVGVLRKEDLHSAFSRRGQQDHPVRGANRSGRYQAGVGPGVGHAFSGDESGAGRKKTAQRSGRCSVHREGPSSSAA